jgi:hypothetical protein
VTVAYPMVRSRYDEVLKKMTKDKQLSDDTATGGEKSWAVVSDEKSRCIIYIVSSDKNHIKDIWLHSKFCGKNGIIVLFMLRHTYSVAICFNRL